jgi:hypothetical protein
MEPALRAELEEALLNNTGQLGKIFVLLSEGKKTNRELAEAGGAANSGAAANLRVTVQAVLDGVLPRAPSVAVKTRGSIHSLLRDNPQLSPSARKYLEDLRDSLESIATDADAIEREDADLERSTKQLEQRLAQMPGVYVYTLPSFLRAVQKTDPERFWFKVGKTDRVAGVRVAEQGRATGLPEDPWIARVYWHVQRTPKELETSFHALLEAAGHGRSSGRHAGRDWFTTNLEFLDSIAAALGCSTAQSDESDEMASG